VFAGLAGTVVNSSVTVAVAAIAQDFDASVSDVAVVVVLLNVSMAFLMPLTGLAVRAFGSRRVLMAAGALVAASSALLSLSPGLLALGIARVLQGAGLAAVVPTSVQVTTQLLDDVHRGRPGWWAASNGSAWLAARRGRDDRGWRW
jgi:MFS family permease